MYFASGSFDPPHWSSVVSCSQRWVDKSPEPVMWFHYSVIILYSSSRPTLLSSAPNDNKSDQRECSTLRDNQHKQRARKTFLFPLALFTVSSCCFIFFPIIFMLYCPIQSSFYHLDLLLVFIFFSFFFVDEVLLKDAVFKTLLKLIINNVLLLCLIIMLINIFQRNQSVTVMWTTKGRRQHSLKCLKMLMLPCC